MNYIEEYKKCLETQDKNVLREFFENFTKKFSLNIVFIETLMSLETEKVIEVIEQEMAKRANTIRESISAVCSRNLSHGIGKHVKNL